MGQPLEVAEDLDFNLKTYLDLLRAQHPGISHVVADMQAVDSADLEARIGALHACAEFSAHNRGKQWATTIDRHIEVRKAGASAILSSLPETSQRAPGADGQPYLLLDVFGGAGFIAQFARDFFVFSGTVITSDPSVLMVRLALNKELPAFWQRAQDLLMTRDNSLDAVLFAYGTHHVPIHERLQIFNEAWRVLKPGGALLFHDFPQQGAVSRWFTEVVDRYTLTGHKHEHFSRELVAGYYATARFHLHLLTEIDDYFQFVGANSNAVLMKAIEFMIGAYGLEKLEKSPEGKHFLWERVRDIFCVEELSAAAAPGQVCRAVIHRPALLGVGIKPC